MRILWCDRVNLNAPSMLMMRRMLGRLLVNKITFVFATKIFDMPKEFPPKDYDVVVIGPIATDLDAWGRLEEYSIPKVMICSDPISNMGSHVIYAKQYKVENLWFLYPFYIPQYKKRLPDSVKYDVLPWWISDLKTNVAKDINITYAISDNPMYPIRYLMSRDRRLTERKNIVKFGIGKNRLEWIQYYDILNRSKLLVFDAATYDYPILKYVEGMMAECCVLAPIPDNPKILHLEPNENFVPISDEDYIEKINHYLDDDYEAAKRIASNGRQTFLKYNTTEIRAKQIIEKLEKIVNGQS